MLWAQMIKLGPVKTAWVFYGACGLVLAYLCSIIFRKRPADQEHARANLRDESTDL